MANMFALILVIATFVTGVIWILYRFELISKYSETHKYVTTQTFNNSKKKKIRYIMLSWIEPCVSLFPILMLVLIMRSFIYEPFQIPSGSVMPTLLIGDFILVEKFAYGIKEPITQYNIIKTGHPKRGDLVVFKYPLDEHLNYIKRVIGLPGDKVTYNPYSKEITISKVIQHNNNTYNTNIPIIYTKNKPSEWVQTFNNLQNGKVSTNFLKIPINHNIQDGYRMDDRTEILGNVAHHILTIPQAQDIMLRYYHQPGQPNGVWIVPKGCYFMMGDNRDNSSDSRYWGFIPDKNLVGKATIIWMSLEKQAGKWPIGLRLHRIGNIQ
ncbi:Signal peptidase I [Candidatus Profftia lariciata]|uniref:signal peptidase I n=1 Tax=Candidatus Profftia lariciata TaxID=1987921 RepID=UPI001D00EED9|nr:signal peptidase I [Candidatus Profftia lariciata]UDG81258.1 Signal peptidase I [Candidatus Profftia lariciata]